MKAIINIMVSIALIWPGAYEATAQSPSSFAGSMELAEKHLHNNDCEEALQFANVAIERRQQAFEAHQLRGMINECLQRPDAALYDYTVALSISPEHPEILYNRAILAYQTGKFHLAEEDLLRLLGLPGSVTNMVYYKKPVKASGISSISTMETMEAEVMNQLGLTLMELNDYDRALRYFDSAIMHQEASMYFNNRGLLHQQTGKTEAARSDFLRAIQLDSTNASALYNYTGLPGTQANNKAIIEQLTRLMDRGNARPELYAQRGIAYYHEGKLNSAVRDFNTAIRLDDEKAEYFVNRGMAYAKMNETKHAIDDFTIAIGLQSSYSKAYLNRGNAHFMIRSYKKAIRDYDLALMLDPDNLQARYNRAMSFFSIGEVEQACRDLQISKEQGMKEAEEFIETKCETQ